MKSLRVDNDEICAAIKDVFDDTRAIVEPAGALAVAGLKVYAERTGNRGKDFVALLSGANMNFDRLRFVAERAEVGEFREALFGVTIPGKARGVPAVLFCARTARDHGIQLPAELAKQRRDLRRHEHPQPRGRDGCAVEAERDGI